jgi:para-nitrobenzyl esterase
MLKPAVFLASIGTLAVLVSCNKPADGPAHAGTDSAAVPAAASADSEAPPNIVAPGPLAGTSWQLVQFQSSDGKTLTPDDRAKYAVTLGADGRVSVRADCNRGSGTWSSPEANVLAFGAIASTRAMCPEGSMSDRLLRDFQYMTSYLIKDGKLHISLMADGGIYEFEPAP